MMNNTVGKRLRWLRYVGEVTQAEVGALAELSSAYVGHIENGRRSPLAENLASIALVLGCSLDWLCSGTGEQPTRAEVFGALTIARDSRGVEL